MRCNRPATRSICTDAHPFTHGQLVPIFPIFSIFNNDDNNNGFIFIIIIIFSYIILYLRASNELRPRDGDSDVISQVSLRCHYISALSLEFFSILKYGKKTTVRRIYIHIIYNTTAACTASFR